MSVVNVDHNIHLTALLSRCYRAIRTLCPAQSIDRNQYIRIVHVSFNDKIQYSIRKKSLPVNGLISCVNPDSNPFGHDRLTMVSGVWAPDEVPGANCVFLSVDALPEHGVNFIDFDQRDYRDRIFLRDLMAIRASTPKEVGVSSWDQSLEEPRYSCLYIPEGGIEKLISLLDTIPMHRRVLENKLRAMYKSFSQKRQCGVIACFYSTYETGLGAPIALTYTAEASDYLFFPALVHPAESDQVKTYHRIFLGADRFSRGNDFGIMDEGVPPVSAEFAALLAPQLCYVGLDIHRDNGDYIWEITAEGVNSWEAMIRA